MNNDNNVSDVGGFKYDGIRFHAVTNELQTTISSAFISLPEAACLTHDGSELQVERKGVSQLWTRPSACDHEKLLFGGYEQLNHV